MLIAKIYFQVTDYHRATRFLGWGIKKAHPVSQMSLNIVFHRNCDLISKLLL